MQIEQLKWTPEKTWESVRSDSKNAQDYQLVIVFGSTTLLSSNGFYEEIRNKYPTAEIMMNSTSGEIIDTQVNDETISLTAIRFDKTKIQSNSILIKDCLNSREAGNKIAEKFEKQNLSNILIFIFICRISVI